MSTLPFANLIERLENASGTNDKLALLKANIADTDTRRLFNTALSPFITMGIKQFDLPTEFGDETSTKPFYVLTEDLNARQLRGDAARAEITRVLSLYPERVANVLVQVLRQKFKCRVGSSLINKAAGTAVVDEYDVMLADKFTPKFKWHSDPYFVEWKYDGMRLIAEWLPDDSITYRSREGLVQENVPDHITDGLRESARLLIAARPGEDWSLGIEFDGEVMADTYSDTMRMMKNTDVNKDRSTLRFYLFDVIPRTAWMVRKYDRKFMDRRRDVESCVHGDIILATKGELCATKDDVMAVYARLVEDGAEGGMIKTVDHLYQWKRSKAWTKFKPVFSADLECYAIYEGDELNGFKGTLGGLKLRGKLEDGTYVECDCGSGFKMIRRSPDDEPTRDEIWANPDLVLGQIIEAEYQEVSLAQTKDIKSLRFVVFKRVRVDKTVSK